MNETKPCPCGGTNPISVPCGMDDNGKDTYHTVCGDCLRPIKSTNK